MTACSNCAMPQGQRPMADHDPNKWDAKFMLWGLFIIGVLTWVVAYVVPHVVHLMDRIY